MSSSSQTNCYEFKLRAPSTRTLTATLGDHGLRHTIYREPHYSDPVDRPTTVTYDAMTGARFDYRGGIGEWSDGAVWRNRVYSLDGRGVHGWEYATSRPPPRLGEIRRWLSKEGDGSGIASLHSTQSQSRFRSQVRTQ